MKEAQKANEMDGSEEVVEERTYDKKDFMKNNEIVMEWIRRQKKEAYEVAEAFNAQLRKGEDDTDDVLSEEGDVSVGRERSSQRFSLLDSIASAFGVKKGGVRWMN